MIWLYWISIYLILGSLFSIWFTNWITRYTIGIDENGERQDNYCSASGTRIINNRLVIFNKKRFTSYFIVLTIAGIPMFIFVAIFGLL